ncbi:MAG: ATP-binding protein [Chloroflexi bacterium]|nr:ATP-binding protein [Chloroflexota bacterium]
MSPIAAVERDVGLLRRELPPLPAALAKPVLIVVVGLPGTGKSYFSRRFAERSPVLVLETDMLRKALFPSPSYGAEESARLFRATHQLLEELLREDIPVLLDATNLVEAHRETLYHIAEQAGAKLILVRTKAPESLVQRRLALRQSSERREDHPDAGWEVYRRMRTTQEPIRRSHYTVDTSGDISPVLGKILREVRRWLRSS